MKKIGNIGYATVLLLVLSIPLGMAFIHGINFLLPLQFKKFMLVISIMVLFIAGILHHLFRGSSISSDKAKCLIWIPLLLFFISLILKIFIAYAEGCDIFQNTEYGCVLRIASGLATEDDLRHISVFPHWSLVGILDGCFVRLFYNTPPYLVCEYVNAVLLSISVLLIYYTAYFSLKNIEASIFGGLLFAIAPTENLYFLMISNEFWAICFISVFVFLVTRFKMMLPIADMGGDKKAFIVILSGISLWVIKYSKPISGVFFIAIIICWLYWVFEGKWSLKDKKFHIALLMLICIALTSSLLSVVYKKALSGKTCFPINENQAPHFLFIGLDPYYQKVGNVYEDRIIEADYDYDAVNSGYMNAVKKDLAENISFLPEKLKENFRLQWGDYGNGIRMSVHRFYEAGTGKSFFNLILAERWLKPLTQFYYLYVLLFAMVSVISHFINLFANREKQSENINYLFITLCVLGVALGLSIGEAQERYKCVIMPLVYLLAGDGIYYFWLYLDKAVSRLFLVKRNIISIARREA